MSPGDDYVVRIIIMRLRMLVSVRVELWACEDGVAGPTDYAVVRHSSGSNQAASSLSPFISDNVVLLDDT